MHVINFVFEHGDTLKADTECKALIFFRINAAHFKYMRMHHTAAKDFNPAFTFTHSAAFATAFEACDIHFGTWFCEWEMMRSKLDLCIFAEKLFRKFSQCAFQIGKCDILVNDKAFNLVEVR